jgi:molybdopterin-containing oxidoreductase family iron-sulfur binding subunit
MSATGERRFPAAEPAVRANGELWRSLGELAGAADLRRALEAEFPSLSARLPTAIDRRTLLKLMGASLSLAGLTACSQADEIVPYVRQPEIVVPGRPLYYATTLSSGGYGIGAVVESHEGRPTKVEGNPDHPASLGATDAIMQAAVLELFDPDRSRSPLKDGEPAGYGDFLKSMAALVSHFEATGGKGAALLIGTVTSPTTKAQIEGLRARYPGLRIYRHDALAAPSGEQAAKALFGRALTPVYRFDRADTIVSLDADFLGEGPGKLVYARGFADRRRVRGPADTMSRLYVVESTPTITGAAADHRKPAKPSEMDAVAAALHAAAAGAEAAPASAMPSPLDPAWISALAAELKAAGSKALIVPGEHQTPFVHAVAFAANSRLGAIGNTLSFIEPPRAMPADGDLAALCQDVGSGAVDTLVVLDLDPVQTAPADCDAGKALRRLKLLVHCGIYRDETALLANWHVPAAHDLESWSDLRAFDGTASIVQPLVLPLFGGRTVHEMLAVLGGDFNADPQALVRANWASLDEAAWRKALRDGVVPGTAAPSVPVDVPADLGGLRPRANAADGPEIRFVADPFLRDGRHANAAVLQELPRPLTRMVWGNAALVSPGTAARLRLESGQGINIACRGHDVDAPVWIMPGQPDDVVTLSFGHGRKSPGSVAPLAGGYDAFAVRTGGMPWFADEAVLTPRDGNWPVITTQHHQAMEGRAIVRHASLDEFRGKPDFVRDGAPPAPDETLYADWPNGEEAWGMSIDLSACIGCGACVTACQAEYNIPTVGPEQCALGHEMHWLRIDRYYSGPPEAPETFFQPVPCMHCEKAPCEVVCPVNATVHTHDGLNAQVYNRCIGTRYCSQNCPYKVRRFNFLAFQEFDKDAAGPEQAARNPNVSVRSRGVMEKCTYCVQRISARRIKAQIENRAIADGEVVTACQQACPTRAIVFGDINRKDSKVAREKRAPHSYALLADLNTRPRTTYLGRIRNTSGGPGGDSEAEAGKNG